MLVPVDSWLSEHLYPVVFLGAVVDAIGIPFPGRIMLITVGSLFGPVVDADGRAVGVILLATIGTVVGDHVWYLLGRHKGRRLFEIYGRVVGLSKPRIAQADRFLRRFGGLTLILARFAATLRVVVMPLAVSRGMSYRRFLAFDLVGALIWSAGFVWLGRVAGALGGRGGLAGTLAVVGALALASAVIAVMARRRFSGRVSVS